MNNETKTQVFVGDDNDAPIRFQASLRDVVPCNLRSSAVQFLSSFVDGEFDAQSMVVFLRCYGYLMYNRNEKIELLRRYVDVTDIAAVKIVEALAHCKDRDSFRDCMKVQLNVVRNVFQQGFISSNSCNNNDGTEAMDVDDDDDAFTENYATTSSTTSKNIDPKEYNDLLRLSLSQLTEIVSFIEKNSGYFAETMTMNDQAERLIAGANDTAATACSACWNELSREGDGSATVSTVLSVILRDMLITTGRQTHVMVLFVIRIATILIFLITNFVRNPTAKVRNGGDPTMTYLFAIADAPNDAFAPIVTIDNFVATFIVDIVRRCFATYVNWPSRLLRRDGDTWSLQSVRRFVKRSLKQDPATSLPWIRILRDTIYVKDDVLLGFFEEFSNAYHAVSSADVARRSENNMNSYLQSTIHDVTATNNDVTLGTFREDAANRPVVRANVNLTSRYNEFRRLCDICRDAILQSMGHNSNAALNEQDESVHKLATIGMFSFVCCLDERGERLIDTDVLHDDELLPRLDSTNILRRQTINRSYTALLLAVNMRLLLGVRITQRQITLFVDCMIEMWNERIGICDMNHLTLTFTRLLRIFPTFVADTTATIEAERIDDN